MSTIKKIRKPYVHSSSWLADHKHLKRIIVTVVLPIGDSETLTQKLSFPVEGSEINNTFSKNYYAFNPDRIDLGTIILKNTKNSIKINNFKDDSRLDFFAYKHFRDEKGVIQKIFANHVFVSMNGVISIMSKYECRALIGINCRMQHYFGLFKRKKAKKSSEIDKIHSTVLKSIT